MLRLATTRAARHLTRQAAPACYAGAVRGYAAGGDIVKDVFVDQQKKFRALMDATKDLEVPVGGDRAAIKAYAEKRKAIMAKVRARPPSLGVPRASRRPPNYRSDAASHRTVRASFPPESSPRVSFRVAEAGVLARDRRRNPSRRPQDRVRILPECHLNHQRHSGRSLRLPLRTDPRKPSPPLCPKRTDTAPRLTPPSLPSPAARHQDHGGAHRGHPPGWQGGWYVRARVPQLRRGAALGDGHRGRRRRRQGALGGAVWRWRRRVASPS